MHPEGHHSKRTDGWPHPTYDLNPEIMHDRSRNKPKYIVLFQVLFGYGFEQLESTLKSEYV